MLSGAEFVRQSVEIHLLYLRLFSEHMVFFAAALSSKERPWIEQAETLRCDLTALLAETVVMAQGLISPQARASGELITDYTIRAEQLTEHYTGIPIDIDLSALEQALCDSVHPQINSEILEQVGELNRRGFVLGTAVADYKRRLVQAADACQVLVMVYPSLIKHTLEEAEFYLERLKRLQNVEEPYPLSEANQIFGFWNHIMEEHAEFLRGFLDPRHRDLFQAASRFAAEFEELTKQAQGSAGQFNRALNLRSLDAVNRLRAFKASGTEGMINCRVQAIATPLLADHVLREASHYLRLLNGFIARMP